MILKAPFPWFGGKRRVASIVWERFGNVPNYVEPFFGSGAVLLGRPHKPGIETVNDKDCYIANFWRALQHQPEEVARWADWPVNEADLHARHLWLVEQTAFQEKMKTDPDFHDPKIAGWWVWGICQWIGSGWCKQVDNLPNKLPHVGAGRGINRNNTHLLNYFDDLANRLLKVRVCCGDWIRVLGPAPTTTLGVTGVFLDPPYSNEAGRDPNIYAVEDLSVAHEVREWAIANGDNPLLRIALCGYEGEHDMPEGWEVLSWKAQGGYSYIGNGTGKKNRHRERIWFSPHCVGMKSLFAAAS